MYDALIIFGVLLVIYLGYVAYKHYKPTVTKVEADIAAGVKTVEADIEKL